MSRTTTRPKSRTVNDGRPINDGGGRPEQDLFGKAVEKERPRRRRRSVEDFEADVAELRRKRGSAS